MMIWFEVQIFGRCYFTLLDLKFITLFFFYVYLPNEKKRRQQRQHSVVRTVLSARADYERSELISRRTFLETELNRLNGVTPGNNLHFGIY